MSLVIQKFGGTSVRDAARRDIVAQWVQKAVREGHHVVVVVSAMGRLGDPYATDTLLSLLDNGTEGALDERDLLISCGEIISAVILAGHLRSVGLQSRAITGGDAGIVTDANFGDARIVEVKPQALESLVAQGIVPVVAGFQGRTPDGRVATLGRGGSDTTAVALGAALGAEVVDIFTDVDGIKTADPRIVPEARTISSLDYEEVFQLANLGAKVIHPRAVEIGRQFGVTIRVRSTFSESLGTIIASGQGILDAWGHRDPDHSVTGITQLDHLLQFRVTPPETMHKDWAFQLFMALGERGVSVDLINLFPDQVYFCVPPEKNAVTQEILETSGFGYEAFDDRAKVSIVGSAIQGLPGVVGRVMAAMAQSDIEILQSADSHSTITLLLHRSDMERAVSALHKQFHLAEEVPKG
ncbi:MAG: aspartate kinase [Sulfobacillus thermosulfidooxidans]|uniref:Aspartokinase n=1 Tax=Sulfobacillus thermotolerans TaxID=338644 RepID=A0ABM6RQU7_9FIRM|nr:aspartate kinase [Sulfobacillus sp. hq2]AUW93720.1 aspartate kinase [Sulfobacillus thermotolerans]POB10966.1 aspartate kinase [Sulfobacillus sp. hq2]PSR37615.1 MAG: aspartate kinase [Sulfobacillus thermosulfidooxidans]